MAPTTDPLASVNGDIVRPGVSDIGFATTLLNASSFKRYGAGASKTLIETRYVIFLSPVVVMVIAAALSSPTPSAEGRRGYVFWSLTFLMLMLTTFMFPPPRPNFATSKVLPLTGEVTSVPISTSRIVPMIIMVFLFSM